MQVMTATKTILVIIMGLFSFFGCSTKTEFREGGIYATRQDDGQYTILKVLKIDEHCVHVRMYSNVYKEIPKQVDESTLYMAGMERKPNEVLGMGHAPISKESFSTWGSVFVQQSIVAQSELEGYNMWLEASGSCF